MSKIVVLSYVYQLSLKYVMMMMMTALLPSVEMSAVSLLHLYQKCTVVTATRR